MHSSKDIVIEFKDGYEYCSYQRLDPMYYINVILTFGSFESIPNQIGRYPEWYEPGKAIVRTGEIWSYSLKKKIGLVHIHPGKYKNELNILIILKPQFRSKGLGFKSVQLLFSDIVSFPCLKEIKILINPENSIGIRLLLKLGFVPVLNDMNFTKSLRFAHVLYTMRKKNSFNSLVSSDFK